VPESAEVRDLIEQGFLRVIDIAPILGVTPQRVSQIVDEREDFPKPAKVIGRHRLWRRPDVERWRDARPRAWSHPGGFEEGKFIPPAFQAFHPAIYALPDDVRQMDVLNDGFLLGREGRLAVYYAPFDWINAEARIVIIGLTPGWTQTKIALETVHTALRRGQSDEDAIRAAKAQASFAGMRRRMCGWLDDLGVAKWLDISGTEDLFDTQRQLLQTTSAIRYPVFVGDDARNYSGHSPKPPKSPLLMSIIETMLLPELALLSDALVVPLGRGVASAIAGRVDPSRCLFGFPHPSGASPHGPRQFEEERNQMRAVLEGLPALP
jgi:hypothetical protein